MPNAGSIPPPGAFLPASESLCSECCISDRTLNQFEVYRLARPNRRLKPKVKTRRDKEESFPVTVYDGRNSDARANRCQVSL